MLSLQHSHGYSGSFLNYITMDNRFLDLIERSIKEHWDLPAFSDYNGHTFHFKDVARRIEKFHILLDMLVSRKATKWSIVGRNSSNWAICFFGILAYGAVAVPILHEFKPDNIHHIVNHSGAKAVLAGSSNWENMNEKMMPDVKLFMMLDNFSIIDCKNKEVRTIRDRINEIFWQEISPFFHRQRCEISYRRPGGIGCFELYVRHDQLLERSHDPLPQFVEQHTVRLRPSSFHTSRRQHRLYVTDGAHVRVSVRSAELRQQRLPRSFPDTHAESKNHRRGICDGSTGADPCRATHYREDHQEQGLSRTGKAIDQIAVESAIHRPKGTREDRPKSWKPLSVGTSAKS